MSSGSRLVELYERAVASAEADSFLDHGGSEGESVGASPRPADGRGSNGNNKNNNNSKKKKRSISVKSPAPSSSPARTDGGGGGDGGGGDGTSDDQEPEKKRSRRGRKQAHPFVRQHFVTLSEKFPYVSTGLPSPYNTCICKYCQQAYDEAAAENDPDVAEPKKLRQTKYDCEVHLRNCKHYKAKGNPRRLELQAPRRKSKASKTTTTGTAAAGVGAGGVVVDHKTVRKIRLGMVGGGEGGYIGALHRNAMGMDGQYALVCGAFSRDADVNLATAAKLGIEPSRAYSSYAELLEKELRLPDDQRIHALTVATPHGTHVPVAMGAARAGIDVMCEKPAGVSAAEALELSKVLKHTGAFFCLANTYVGYPMVWQARSLISSGLLGRVRKINVEYPQGWLCQYVEGDNNGRASWRTDPDQVGTSGCMGDIGTQAFGLAEFVTGHKITSLSAMMNTVVVGRAMDDDGAAFFRTDRDASGTLIASQVCAGEEAGSLRIRVYGEKGGLEWNQADPGNLAHRPANAPHRIFRTRSGMPELCDQAKALCRTVGGHHEGYLEAFANLYTMFASKIRGDARAETHEGMLPGIEEGIRGLSFVETMVASSRSDSAWMEIPTHKTPRT